MFRATVTGPMRWHSWWEYWFLPQIEVMGGHCHPIIIRILKFFTMCLCNLKSPHEQTSTCEICNQNFAEVLWGSLTRPFWLSKNMFNLSLHKQDLERSSLPPCTPHPQLSVDERAHSVVYRAYHGALCSRQSSELWVENPTADLIFS